MEVNLPLTIMGDYFAVENPAHVSYCVLSAFSSELLHVNVSTKNIIFPDNWRSFLLPREKTLNATQSTDLKQRELEATDFDAQVLACNIANTFAILEPRCDLDL